MWPTTFLVAAIVTQLSIWWVEKPMPEPQPEQVVKYLEKSIEVFASKCVSIPSGFYKISFDKEEPKLRDLTNWGAFKGCKLKKVKTKRGK